MKEIVDFIYVILIALLCVGSIFLNIWLVNAYRYYKTCTKSAEHEVHYWRGTALLYRKQMHEAADRHWETLDKMAERA